MTRDLLVGDNPLKSDPELVALLKKLDAIVKYKYFQRWKKSFLDRLLPKILVHDKRSMQVADQASEDFDRVLATTAKQARKVVDFENLNSVKATLALRELGNLLQKTTATLKEWIPASSQEEKRQGYTKFHLGAALIQQGFPQYVTLKGMEDALKRIETKVLPHTADRQLSDVFRGYHTQVDRFCDVMADLGMFEIMKKCLQFAIAPDVEESSDEEAMNITIQGETIKGVHHSIDMEVEPSESLAGLRQTVQQEFGIPLSHLVLKHRGKELPRDDDKTLGKAGIEDESIIHVELRNIPLLVHVYGKEKEIPVYVTCRNTLQDIKERVEPTSGIAVLQQRIFRQNKPANEVKDNGMSVQEYGFVDNEHLVLEPNFISVRVKIPDTTESFDLELGLDETTEDIQTKITQKTGMENQEFTTTNPKTKEELPVRRTVRDMELHDGNVLTVALNKIPLTIKHKSDGTTVTELFVHPTKNNLAFVKEHIKQACDVDPVRQILFHDKKRLDDEMKTPRSIGLKPHSVLYLDTGPVEIRSIGDIYVAFTVSIKEAPSEREYKELAKVTEDFYKKQLKKRYRGAFQSVTVKCHKALFEAEKPSSKFNVYVEWDFTATFDASSSQDANVEIPSRHSMCTFLAKLDLEPYLTKVSKMPTRSFSKTRGVYTEHV
uniref:Ubiquitin-like domain-containing protein n=1 Tax=Amphora coffeiformis TaxID=265554 RepID=A0A7S3P120_9STRA